MLGDLRVDTESDRCSFSRQVGKAHRATLALNPDSRTVNDLFRRGHDGSPQQSFHQVPVSAAFLCADLGITLDIRANHADYIGHRLNVLRRRQAGDFQCRSLCDGSVD
jgi:antirestriction protein ArdC